MSCSVTLYHLDVGTSCPALICAKQDLFSLLLIPSSSVRLGGVQEAFAQTHKPRHWYKSLRLLCLLRTSERLCFSNRSTALCCSVSLQFSRSVWRNQSDPRCVHESPRHEVLELREQHPFQTESILVFQRKIQAFSCGSAPVLVSGITAVPSGFPGAHPYPSLSLTRVCLWLPTTPTSSSKAHVVPAEWLFTGDLARLLDQNKIFGDLGFS